MPDWLYHQSTGELFYLDGVRTQPFDTGYSGYGSCKNRPELQGVKQLGPIPRGKYAIGALTEIAGGRVKNAVPLTPDPANDMMGRDGFFVHGDSTVKPGEASEGCIICKLETRQRMAASASTLHVEKGP